MSEASPERPPANRRRWMRFSLRTLLIATTIIGVGLGYFASKAQRQQRAIEGVERLHGMIKFDYQENQSGQYVVEHESPAPDWARDTLFEEFFREVHEIHFTAGTSAGRSGMFRKEELVNLSDDDLEILSGLTSLRRLYLAKNPITDQGLYHLRKLRQLEVLHLDETAIQGPGFAHLTSLSNLTALMASDMPLRDDELRFIGQLQNLEYLMLNDTEITSAGLKHLAGLTNLQELHLMGNNIDDSGVEHLAGLSQLVRLYLRDTHVTEAAAARLREALPNCLVFLPSRDGLF